MFNLDACNAGKTPEIIPTTNENETAANTKGHETRTSIPVPPKNPPAKYATPKAKDNPTIAPTIPPTGTAKVMLDLVDSPSFLLFVAKYGAPSFRDLDEETLCRLAQHEIFMKTGLNLSFGDRPLVPALPIFIPPYF